MKTKITLSVEVDATPDELEELNFALIAQLEDLKHTNLEIKEEAIVRDEACPGCGCMPGDGVTESCNHPDGCGWSKSNM